MGAAVTPQDVRRIALSLPEVIESEHMGQPDFRAGGKAFATLPDPKRVMVRLHHEQQERLVRSDPARFAPAEDGLGHLGWTALSLAAADEAALETTLKMAWRNVAPKSAIFRLAGNTRVS
jgi:hypothetical protein